jgi:uncharacterized membrane protein YkoI
MFDMLGRREFLLALTLLVAGVSAASSDDLDDDRDHEEAHRALQHGLALPLAVILKTVEEQVGGDVVGVELEREDGRYVYELKIVAPDGRLREVYVDAMTGAILSGGRD